MQETQQTEAWSLGWEHPLEEGMVIHCSILAWRIPRSEEPSRLQSIESQRVKHDWSDWARMHIAKKKKCLPDDGFIITHYKAEHRRIDSFELWCERRFLRVLWTARWANQSILKEINPGYSLERLTLKLMLQNFGHLMWRADSDYDAGKDWRQEEKGGATGDEMVGWHHWLNGHEFVQAPGDGEEQGSLVCCRVGYD